MRARDLLLDFLDSFQSLAGAESAALLLHSEPIERQAMMLASRDVDDALPEFGGEDSAWDLVSSHASSVVDARRVTVLPSTDPDGAIVRIAFSRIIERPNVQRRLVDERRREPDISTGPSSDGAIWIGLRRATRLNELLDELRIGAEKLAQGDADSGSLISVCLRTVWSVYHLSGLLHDPISQLPGRMEMRQFLKRAIAAGRVHKQALGIMLVNPDDFTMINHRYGRRHGDAAVRQIAAQLVNSLRSTDGVFHYGGAVFAAVLPATEFDQCRIAAEKVRRQLTTHRYVDDKAALTFSIGAALASSHDLTVCEGIEALLTRSADTALNTAKLSGGAKIIVTDLARKDDRGVLSNPLNGIFAADTEKDYRNMLLLWETIALISKQTDPESIATAFVDRMAIGFRPDRAAFLAVTNGEIDMLASNIRDESATDGRVSGRALNLDDSCRNVVLEAVENRRVVRSQHDDAKNKGFSAYAVPLVVGDAILGCLYLDAGGRRLQLDSSDVVFLNALAAQMAVAMDRAELAARWIREKDHESRLLREEVRGLRQALHHTKLVYQSDAMHSVMETLRKVAPSDATVLIVGESGTGKEMLAQSLHELSDRRDAPFVVFDCGAVAHSLLEAELFGHKKGAFTGAESASEGRIAQAEGGTLFLDEIGELPLEVQAKLLRFVQEKQFSPVGSADTRKVDVRIVAATNRELQEEVGSGRFRADLYYRLRVISVRAVPLRERSDDVLPLARFFLEKFATQYGRPTIRFCETAQNKLLDYSWPGNVRELQNCVLRAVLTNEGDVLQAHAIELFPESPGGATPGADESTHRGVPNITSLPVAGGAGVQDDPWQALQHELERQVEEAVSDNTRRPAPVGRWLAEDLVLAADDVCHNVARRAAKLIGVPESTFRRQLEKATSGNLTGGQYRSESWVTIRPRIRQVIEQSDTASQVQGNLLERARDVLLKCVSARMSARPGAGAALMGVTPPTYKRWLQAQERMT